MPDWADELFTHAEPVAERSNTSHAVGQVVPSRLPGMPHQRIFKQKNKLSEPVQCAECNVLPRRKLPGGGCGCQYPSFREYYSGHGGLSRSARRRGLRTIEFEAYHGGRFDAGKDLGNPQVITKEITDARRGLITGAHFGIPCNSWCQMSQKYNGGTRTYDSPLGDGSLARETQGNQQLEQMLRLTSVFLELGIPFTIENPCDSMLWHAETIVALRQDPSVSEVVVDLCMYKLRPPDFSGTEGVDVRVRKRTRFVGTVQGLVGLKRMCDGEHAHAAAWGSCKVNNKTVARAKAAGAYPPCFCHSLSSLFANNQSA